MPVRAVTEACRPAWLRSALVGAEIDGVVGAATTVVVAPPATPLVDPLRSVQVRDSVPTAPAVKVMVFRPLPMTPAVPPALVMVPPEMVHR